MAIQDAPQIAISRIDAETLYVPVVGTAPLITHAWSEKAKKMMLDAMQGRRVPKEPKDPEAEFRAAIYHTDDGGYGVPALSFKCATVEASRLYGKAVTKVGLRQTLFFRGEYSKSAQQMLTKLEVPEPTQREDVVRVGISGTDLRYRPEYVADWKAILRVVYIKSSLTRESVVSLIDAGGQTVGIGEWRPERDGDFGTYMIDPTREIQVES